MTLGQRGVQPVGAAVRVAVELASARASASRAAGNGPNGPSFDASLMTRSSPSSRWHVLDRLSRLYGVRALTLGGRTNRRRPVPARARCRRSAMFAIGQTLASAHAVARAHTRRHPASVARSPGGDPTGTLCRREPSSRPGLRRLQGWRELRSLPLPLVLVPTQRIPLHIFEPRYLELIEECVATGGDFGLVLADRRRRRARGRHSGCGGGGARGARRRSVNVVVEGGERGSASLS